MSKLRPYFIFVWMFLMWLFAYAVFASEVIDPMPESYLLQASPEMILDHREIPFIEFDVRTGISVDKGDIIEYDYVSLERVEKDVLFTDGDYSNIEVITPGRYRFYTAPLFFRADDGIHEIKSATTTIDAWVIQNKISAWQKLKNSFIALADTIYADSGDGLCWKGQDASWDNVHNASSATNCGTQPSGWGVGLEKYPNYMIKRGFFPFDTSSIPSGSTIDSASLFIYIDSIHSDDTRSQNYYTTVSQNQTSVSSLTVNDYGTFGSTKLSDDLNMSTLSVDAYNEFTLNGDGLNAIVPEGYTKLGVITGFDFEDVPITGSNVYNEPAMQYYGEANPPYLEVEFTEPAGTPAWQVATSTGYRLNSAEFALILILFFILFLLVALAGEWLLNWFKLILYDRY